MFSARLLHHAAVTSVLALLCFSEADSSTRWTQLTPVHSPSARYGHVEIFDSYHRRFIVFGGTNGSSWYSDTWRLSADGCGVDWDSVSTTGGPPARAFASAIYDSLNNRMVVFGGQNGSGLTNSTWVLNLSTWQWSDLSPSGTAPCARRGAAVAYNPSDPAMYLHEGETVAGAIASWDSWKLTLPTSGTPTWSRISPSTSGCLCDTINHACTSQPQEAGFVSGVYDPHTCDGKTGRMLRIGGEDPTDKGTAISWGFGCLAFSDASWTQFSEPPQVGLWATAYDRTRSRVIAFGGDDLNNGVPGVYGYGNDLYTVDVTSNPPSWTSLSLSPSPSQRVFHAGAYDQVRDVFCVFGGRNSSGSALSDTWMLEFDRQRAPGEVTDLSVTRLGSGYATLGWTAPEEDSSSAGNRSCVYDIRYSTSTITDANFGSATSAVGPAPGTPGSQDTLHISPLANNTFYYFALKTSDAYGNKSLLSNVTCARPPSTYCDEGGGQSARLAVEKVQLAIQSVLPNPTRDAMRVDFTLASRSPAEIAVFDVAGREIWKRSLGAHALGKQSLTVPVPAAARSGYYVVRVRQDGTSAERSIVLLR